MKIETRSKDTSVITEYNIGETLKEAIDLFGEDVVYSQFRKGAVLSVQAKVRNILGKDGATEADVQAALKGWKIGVAPVRSVDWDKKVDKMSKDQLKALLEAIKRKQTAPAA